VRRSQGSHAAQDEKEKAYADQRNKNSQRKGRGASRRHAIGGPITVR
jgi:hypothetical protein